MVHVIIFLDIVDLFLFLFKDRKFLKIKIDFLKMNFDKNCSLSTQVYVNYISCPNNFKISCHPSPSYNSLIISTLVLKNYEDLIPPHLFQTCVIQISQLFVYTWDSTGWYFYIRGTALDQKLLVSVYLIYYRLTEILVWRHRSSTTRWLVKSLLLTGQIFMSFCH